MAHWRWAVPGPLVAHPLPEEVGTLAAHQPPVEAATWAEVQWLAWGHPRFCFLPVLIDLAWIRPCLLLTDIAIATVLSC